MSVLAAGPVADHYVAAAPTGAWVRSYTAVADWFATTSPKTITGLSWSASDVVVVVMKAENGDNLLNAPTNANLTFASRAFTDQSTSEAQIYLYTAQAGSAQSSQTISVARSAGTGQWGFEVWICPGASGSFANIANNLTESAFSFTPTANSLVIYAEADWSATTGKTILAGTGTATERSDFGNGTSYGGYSGDWAGVSASSTSFGISSYAGTTVNHLVIEVLAGAPLTPKQITLNPKVCTNWGHQISNATALVKGNTTCKYIDALAASPTVGTLGVPRNVQYLELNPSATTEYVSWKTDTLGTTMNRQLISLWILFPSLPGACQVVDFFYSPSDLGIRVDGSNRLCLEYNSFAQTSVGPTLVANTWYHVEVYIDTSANPWVCKWRVDGVGYTDLSVSAAATSLVETQLGTSDQTQTMTCRYSDVIIWTNNAAISDYPVGKHKVMLLEADTGAATAEIGTANATARFVSNSTVDTTHNSANILTAITEGPPPILGASASGVAQRTSGATNAVGIPMGTYTLGNGESISGMRVVLVGWASSTLASNIGLRTFNGTTETILFAQAVSGFDNNTTAPAFLCKMATLADFDTQAELDALVVRLGYSTDISPNPGAHAVYAEVAIREGQ